MKKHFALHIFGTHCFNTTVEDHVSVHHIHVDLQSTDHFLAEKKVDKGSFVLTNARDFPTFTEFFYLTRYSRRVLNGPIEIAPFTRHFQIVLRI